MPKKKKSKNKSKSRMIGIILVLVIIATSVIMWHDGVILTTSIRDINQGDVESGTSVTIKGELTILVGNLMTVSENGAGIGFMWEGTKPPLHSIVVVRGVVENPIWLRDVTSVEAIWVLS